MVGLVMHRLARTRYAGSLEAHLAAGEIISSPQLIAERRVGEAWVMATDEFLQSGSVAVGTGSVAVAFTKKEAADGEQLAGAWRVTAIATSSDQEVVVGWVPVEVVG